MIQLDVPFIMFLSGLGMARQPLNALSVNACMCVTGCKFLSEGKHRSSRNKDMGGLLQEAGQDFLLHYAGQQEGRIADVKLELANMLSRSACMVQSAQQYAT